MNSQTAAEILDQVKDVLANREGNYDAPRDNFQRIADIYRVIDVAPASPEKVALLNIGQKIGRLAYALANEMDQDDSWLDIIGYAVCGLRCAQERRAESKEPVAVEEIVRYAPDPNRPGWFLGEDQTVLLSPVAKPGDLLVGYAECDGTCNPPLKADELAYYDEPLVFHAGYCLSPHQDPTEYPWPPRETGSLDGCFDKDYPPGAAIKTCCFDHDRPLGMWEKIEPDCTWPEPPPGTRRD